MHTKDAGTVGELAVILQLKQAGYGVFTEVGDNSSIDLIVISKSKLFRARSSPVGWWTERLFCHSAKLAQVVTCEST
jgi:hypothetical protein